MKTEEASLEFPGAGEVYDYCLFDHDVQSKNDDENEEETTCDWKPEWVSWLSKSDEYSVPEGSSFTGGI